MLTNLKPFVCVRRYELMDFITSYAGLCARFGSGRTEGTRGKNRIQNGKSWNACVNPRILCAHTHAHRTLACIIMNSENFCQTNLISRFFCFCFAVLCRNRKELIWDSLTQRQKSYHTIPFCRMCVRCTVLPFTLSGSSACVRGWTRVSVRNILTMPYNGEKKFLKQKKKRGEHRLLKITNAACN